VKALLLALALTFAASQAVTWADCCCGTFCQHKNACTGCGPEDACPGGQKKSSCCDEDESQSKETCSHVEPSSEIDTAAVDVRIPPQPTLDLAPHLILSAPPPRPAPPMVAMDTGPPRAGPSDALPLHLYLSVLLI